MYNVNIYPECKNEEEYAVILSVISNMLDNVNDSSDFIARPLKRTQVNVPAWSAVSRHERFENKF